MPLRFNGYQINVLPDEFHDYWAQFSHSHATFLLYYFIFMYATLKEKWKWLIITFTRFFLINTYDNTLGCSFNRCQPIQRAKLTSVVWMCVMSLRSVSTLLCCVFIQSSFSDGVHHAIAVLTEWKEVSQQWKDTTECCSRFNMSIL